MQRTNFENLRIYQLSEELSDHIWEICSGWDVFARDTIGKQMVRSADSVGANISEGVGRWGLQDQKRFIFMARGSLNETKHWLRRSFKRNLLTDEQVRILKPKLDELAPKLNAYINALGRLKDQKQPSTIDDPPSSL